MSQENVEVVRRIFEASVRRDVETVLALYDPDVEWDGSRHRWGEVMVGDLKWKGHAALRQFFRRYYEMWEDFEFDIDELLDAGGDVISVVTSRARGRSSGIVVEWTEQVAIWTIRDGKAVRVTWFSSRAEALEAAGLSE